MDGEGQGSDQPHTWVVTTDGPVGATDAGKKGPQKRYILFQNIQWEFSLPLSFHG